MISALDAKVNKNPEILCFVAINTYLSFLLIKYLNLTDNSFV
jgi:hypothetical protein